MPWSQWINSPPVEHNRSITTSGFYGDSDPSPSITAAQQDAILSTDNAAPSSPPDFTSKSVSWFLFVHRPPTDYSGQFSRVISPTIDIAVMKAQVTPSYYPDVPEGSVLETGEQGVDWDYNSEDIAIEYKNEPHIWGAGTIYTFLKEEYADSLRGTWFYSYPGDVVDSISSDTIYISVNGVVQGSIKANDLHDVTPVKNNTYVPSSFTPPPITGNVATLNKTFAHTIPLTSSTIDIAYFSEYDDPAFVDAHTATSFPSIVPTGDSSSIQFEWSVAIRLGIAYTPPQYRYWIPEPLEPPEPPAEYAPRLKVLFP